MKRSKAIKPQQCIIGIILLALVTCSLIQTAFGAPEIQSEWKIVVTAQSANSQTHEAANIFAPFEEVRLIANVTNKNLPQPGIDVSFLVEGPLNLTQKVTQIRNIKSDTQGVASFIFRIPISNQSENQVTGTWQVFASAATLIQSIKGNLTFEVKWPVEIKSVNLVNPEGNQSSFTTETENITAQLSLENINFKPLVVNVTGKITDASNSSISEFKIENVTVSNNASIQIEEKFEFTSEITAGEAIAEFNVYSGNYKDRNIQVAETKKTTFLINITNPENHTTPTNQTKRDIAVIAAGISAKELFTGESLNVTFTVLNKGNETETFLVSLNSDKCQIGNLTVMLQALEQKDFSYLWETANVEAGTYTITVEAERLPGENSFEDNQFKAGTVVLSYPPAFPQTTTLFISLLVISGIFTATLLFLFLKRTNERHSRDSKLLVNLKSSP